MILCYFSSGKVKLYITMFKYYIGVSIVWCAFAKGSDYYDETDDKYMISRDLLQLTTEPTNKLDYSCIDSDSGFYPVAEELVEEGLTFYNFGNMKHTRKSTKKKNASITNGKDTIAGYPYIASVLKTGSHYASGALVDQRWVLTAAEAFYNVRESIRLFRVRLGSVDCKSGGIVLPIQQIVIHPHFRLGRPGSDMAMLRLAKPVDLAVNIQPIGFIEDNGKFELTKFQMIFWPRIIVNGEPLPVQAKYRRHHNILRVSTQKLMPFKQCRLELDSRDEELTVDNFCLRPLGSYQGSCLANVGAPVVAQDGLWGITSGWVGACNITNPSPIVVARVSQPAVIYWIETQLANDSR